jgi:hypothetical protein
VVLWSDSETTFAGTILARGGARSGDGGFVEVSSHQLLNYSGTTDTRAPKGTVGTLLLDPENFYVNANGLPPNSDPTASAISDALVNQLTSNNVVLSTLPSGTLGGAAQGAPQQQSRPGRPCDSGSNKTEINLMCHEIESGG